MSGYIIFFLLNVMEIMFTFVPGYAYCSNNYNVYAYDLENHKIYMGVAICIASFPGRAKLSLLDFARPGNEVTICTTGP